MAIHWITTINTYLPTIGTHYAADDFQQRGLTYAVAAQKTVYMTRREVECDVAQNRMFASIGKREVIQLYHN